MIAHAGGFGWDEAIVLAVPLAVLLALQFAARRRRQREEANEAKRADLAETEGSDGAASPET